MDYLGIKHGTPWGWAVLYHTDAGVKRMLIIERRDAESAARALNGVLVPLVPQGKPPETVPRVAF